MKGKALLEVRSIEEETHENSAEGTGDWDGHDPGEEKETDSLEVDSLQGTVAETDTNSGTSDTHRGGDWEGVLREDEDGDSGAHLHRGTSARGVVGDLVPHDYAHIVSIVSPEWTMGFAYPS